MILQLLYYLVLFIYYLFRALPSIIFFQIQIPSLFICSDLFLTRLRSTFVASLFCIIFAWEMLLAVKLLGISYHTFYIYHFILLTNFCRHEQSLRCSIISWCYAAMLFNLYLFPAQTQDGQVIMCGSILRLQCCFTSTSMTCISLLLCLTHRHLLDVRYCTFAATQLALLCLLQDFFTQLCLECVFFSSGKGILVGRMRQTGRFFEGNVLSWTHQFLPRLILCLGKCIRSTKTLDCKHSVSTFFFVDTHSV